VLSGGGTTLTATAEQRGSVEPPDTADSAQLSVRLMTKTDPSGQGTRIHGGDIVHFRVRLDGPAERARLAVAATPSDAPASVACEETADAPLKPASRPQVCELGDVPGTKTVDVAVRVPREADEVGVTAVAHMRDPGGVQWIRRMADVRFRIRKSPVDRSSASELGTGPSGSEAAGSDAKSGGQVAGSDPVTRSEPRDSGPDAGTDLASDTGPASGTGSAWGTGPAWGIGPAWGTGSASGTGPAASGEAGTPAVPGVVSLGSSGAEEAKGAPAKAAASKGEAGGEHPATPVDLTSPGPRSKAGGTIPGDRDTGNSSVINNKAPESGVEEIGNPSRPAEPGKSREALALPGTAVGGLGEGVVDLTSVPSEARRQLGITKKARPGAQPVAAPAPAVAAGARRGAGKPKPAPSIPHPAPGIPARPVKGSTPPLPTAVLSAPAPMPVPAPAQAPVPAPVAAPPAVPMSGAPIQMPPATAVPAISPAPAQAPGSVPAPGSAPVQGPAPAPAGQVPVPGQDPAAVPGISPAPALGAPLPQEIRPAKEDLMADTDHHQPETVRGLPAAVAAVVLLLLALALQLKLRRRRAFRKSIHS
jgi:hypothetical protein